MCYIIKCTIITQMYYELFSFVVPRNDGAIQIPVLELKVNLVFRKSVLLEWYDLKIITDFLLI